jgi:Flp pilus assembly protein TadG
MSSTSSLLAKSGGRSWRSQRSGVATVESAIVLSIYLLLLLGMMELSIAVVRYGMLADAARRVARTAITRGSMAPNSLGTWGPATTETTADKSDPIAAAVRPTLATMDPKDVRIRVHWPDGGNQPDQRVHVTIAYTHYPLVPIPAWYTQIELQGDSTMRVAH